MTRVVAGVILAGAALVAGCGGASSSSSSGSGSGGGGGGGRASTPQTTRGARPAQSAPRRVERLTLPVRPPARSVRVPILTYHRVHLFATELTKSIPDETVEPSRFADEMAALDQAGYHAVTQAQLFHALFDGARLPAKPVMITVDDGYIDDLQTILPILRRHRMVATFYIITRRFHEPGFVNATQVRRLDAAGMDVGAHTRTHVPLNAVPQAEMISQIEGSKRDLQRALGHFVYFFAYPYGAFSPAVVAEVRRAGFVLAVTTRTGTVERSTTALTMPRIHVGRSATAASLLACVRVGGCGGGGT